MNKLKISLVGIMVLLCGVMQSSERSTSPITTTPAYVGNVNRLQRANRQLPQLGDNTQEVMRSLRARECIRFRLRCGDGVSCGFTDSAKEMTGIERVFVFKNNAGILVFYANGYQRFLP